MTHRLRALVAAGALSAAVLTAPRSAGAADSAVVLMYHHVATGTPAVTSVSPAQFEAHLNYLEQQSFNVWPLLRILQHIEAGEPLPEKTVALTFDDGYVSVVDQAMPALARREWPFTVFVTTDYIDAGYRDYVSWEQIRTLARAGASIGNHTRTHAHLVRRLDGEREARWRERVRAEIETAQQRILDETGSSAPILAYPYGEYDDALEQLVAELGLYGVGQHSGAIGIDSNLLSAPRFPMAGEYADPEQFQLRVRSRALPATVLDAGRRMLDGSARRPALTLRLGEGDFRAGQLACYATGQGRMELEWLDPEIGTVEIRPVRALAPGRTKYNCTAPSSTTSGVYHWFSYLWMQKNADGSWYSE